MYDSRRPRDRILPYQRKAHQYSSEKLAEIKKEIGNLRFPKGVSIFVVGSYARREASKNSDFDYLIFKGPKKLRKAETTDLKIRNVLDQLSIAQPSAGGAFGDFCCDQDDFLANIGGHNETNKSLTRRMLLVLESDSVTDEVVLINLRNQIIERYVSKKMTEHGLARFLLNDLVKFWRTMCVDFEYKTVEDGKDWGIRNIKLAFSRKLIFFSGVLAVAETAQRQATKKQEILASLFQMTPIERIQHVCGATSEAALESYDRFLEMLEDKRKRAKFSMVTMDRATHTSEFRDLKNEAQHFSWHLARLLEQFYPASHPIHHALVF